MGIGGFVLLMQPHSSNGNDSPPPPFGPWGCVIIVLSVVVIGLMAGLGIYFGSK